MEVVVADTNVLVRAIIADEPTQTKKAAKLLKTSIVMVLESVLLETEWVLRSLYGQSRKEVAKSFRILLALRNVQVGRKGLVLSVIAAYEKGFDFADALHRAAAEGVEVKTFDRKFMNRAKKEGWKVSLL